MINCPNCGKSVDEGIAHCGHCGQKMDVDSKKTMLGMAAINTDELQRSIAEAQAKRAAAEAKSAEAASDESAAEAPTIMLPQLKDSGELPSAPATEPMEPVSASMPESTGPGEANPYAETMARVAIADSQAEFTNPGAPGFDSPTHESAPYGSAPLQPSSMESASMEPEMTPGTEKGGELMSMIADGNDKKKLLLILGAVIVLIFGCCVFAAILNFVIF